MNNIYYANDHQVDIIYPTSTTVRLLAQTLSMYYGYLFTWRSPVYVEDISLHRENVRVPGQSIESRGENGI